MYSAIQYTCPNLLTVGFFFALYRVFPYYRFFFFFRDLGNCSACCPYIMCLLMINCPLAYSVSPWFKLAHTSPTDCFKVMGVQWLWTMFLKILGWVHSRFINKMLVQVISCVCLVKCSWYVTHKLFIVKGRAVTLNDSCR